MIRPERNPSQSFFEEYQLISNKLKKRFLRKPNVSEASVEFAGLAGRLSAGELPQYAGLCQLARSRCEMTLNNPAQQTAALIAAAQHFSQAVTACPDERPVQSGSLNAPLLTAVSLYNAAARQQLSQQRPQLAAGSCLQLAAVGVTSQQLHCRDAAELLPPAPSIHAELTALRHCIVHGDLSAVESVLDSIGSSLKEDTLRPASAVHRKHKFRWEILELLFVLTIRSQLDQLKPEQRHLLSRFSPKSEYRHTDGVMSEDMFVTLQSLVMAATRCDLPALYSAESTLHPWLDESQRHLLSLLVQHTELHHVPCAVFVNGETATRA